MAKAFGIVTSSGSHIHVEGMQDYRPIGSFSFLGRYRMVDFPVSNLSNSDIDRIQVYIQQNPRSLAEHLGTGRHYNINSKRGKLQLLFTEDSRINDVYNTDIAGYAAHLDIIERMHQDYVVIVPSYMVYRQDFNELIDAHIESGADITMLYHKVDNADKSYRNCNLMKLNRQRGLKELVRNDGTSADENIFMDTYIMSRDIFVKLIKKAVSTSSVYTLADIINRQAESLDIRGVAHKGYFAAITDFKSFYDANLELLDIDLADTMFTEEWPFYTRTTDSSPVHYFEGCKVKNSMVSNGSLIEGSIENCVIGRNVEIKKGAVLKNCVVLAQAVIGEGVYLENQVVDKWAKITNVKKIVAEPDKPGYIRRNDVL